MTNEIEVDDFLEHFGVKGMRWGVSRANRQLNRESRAKDTYKLHNEVLKARQKVDTGKTKKNFKEAKAKFKEDKYTLGTREARKALNKAKEKKLKEVQLSRTPITGKEKAGAVLAVVGAYVLANVVANELAKA